MIVTTLIEFLANDIYKVIIFIEEYHHSPNHATYPC